LLLYYITDAAQFAGTDGERQAHLLDRIAQAAGLGIDFIQLRERNLVTHDLEALARKAVETVRAGPSRKTRLLINSRSDVALATGADGVHLRSKDISPSEVHRIWQAAGSSANAVVAVSCHSPEDVADAAKGGADFVVFGPVFEKKDCRGPVTGLTLLREVCDYPIPVLALGGVSGENAHLCVQAGAAGLAGIRLFQEDDMTDTTARLRPLK